jgi:hypothetical protein
MKLLIQLTFNNGLGNLYCGLVEVINFVTKYKELGYNCELIFASNGNSGSNKFINFIEIGEIFDLDILSVFDRVRSIENSISSKEFEGYKYHSTQYGPDFPGAHWWDVFFDEFPDEVLPKYAYNMETLFSGQLLSKHLPKFNGKIYEKVLKFKQENEEVKNAIQIRYFDYRINPEPEFKEYMDKLYEKVKNSKNKFHVMSNNDFAVSKLKELDNVVTYKFNNVDELPNDHGYYFYHKNFEREILLDRLYDNIAEMIVLKDYENVYYSTSYSWASTFLYYSKSNNPDLKLININSNLDLIE